MLKELKQAAGLEGRLAGSILDQGDAVGAWQSDAMAVVVFPTAETLKQACVRQRAAHTVDVLSPSAIAAAPWLLAKLMAKYRVYPPCKLSVVSIVLHGSILYTCNESQVWLL